MWPLVNARSVCLNNLSRASQRQLWSSERNVAQRAVRIWLGSGTGSPGSQPHGATWRGFSQGHGASPSQHDGATRRGWPHSRSGDAQEAPWRCGPGRSPRRRRRRTSARGIRRDARHSRSHAGPSGGAAATASRGPPRPSALYAEIRASANAARRTSDRRESVLGHPKLTHLGHQKLTHPA